VSVQEQESKQADYNSAKARLSSANAEVAADQGDVDRLRTLTNFKNITVPFDGIVTARETDVGALINAGSGTGGGNGPELFRVADVHKMRIYVQVPQQMSAGIKAGLNAELQLPQYPNKTFKASVATTSSAINPNGRTLLVELPSIKGVPFGCRSGVPFQRRLTGESLDTASTTETLQTFPNGCHIAEVEIDPETGGVEVVAYNAVDDSGQLLEPVLVEGQIHGGVVQGIGQALLEQAIYDADTGQLVTGSFTDYAMPRACDVPPIYAVSCPFPAATNPLGIKGAGESGTTGSLAAIMLAIDDALPASGKGTVDMPATPAKIWRACIDAEATDRQALRGTD
jgi:hypothetical protein